MKRTFGQGERRLQAFVAKIDEYLNGIEKKKDLIE